MTTHLLFAANTSKKKGVKTIPGINISQPNLSIRPPHDFQLIEIPGLIPFAVPTQNASLLVNDIKDKLSSGFAGTFPIPDGRPIDFLAAMQADSTIHGDERKLFNVAFPQVDELRLLYTGSSMDFYRINHRTKRISQHNTPALAIRQRDRNVVLSKPNALLSDPHIPKFQALHIATLPSNTLFIGGQFSSPDNNNLFPPIDLSGTPLAILVRFVNTKGLLKNRKKRLQTDMIFFRHESATSNGNDSTSDLFGWFSLGAPNSSISSQSEQHSAINTINNRLARLVLDTPHWQKTGHERIASSLLVHFDYGITKPQDRSNTTIPKSYVAKPVAYTPLESPPTTNSGDLLLHIVPGVTERITFERLVPVHSNPISRSIALHNYHP